jgi:hypothetical protein
MKEGPKKKKRVTLWISLLLFEFNHLGQLLFSTNQDSKKLLLFYLGSAVPVTMKWKKKK